MNNSFVMKFLDTINQYNSASPNMHSHSCLQNNILKLADCLCCLKHYLRFIICHEIMIFCGFCLKFSTSSYCLKMNYCTICNNIFICFVQTSSIWMKSHQLINNILRKISLFFVLSSITNKALFSHKGLRFANRRDYYCRVL